MRSLASIPNETENDTIEAVVQIMKANFCRHVHPPPHPQRNSD